MSLTPSTTETVFALGAGSRLVGRSRYCNYPPEVKKLPSVGGYVDPSLEAILALRPSLVTGARGPGGRSLADTLEARGLTCYFPATECIDEISGMILGLAKRLEVPASGEKVVGDIRRRLRAVERSVEGRPRPRALLVFGQSPVVVAGPGSFPDEMLGRAGCLNVVSSGSHYPVLGFEKILALNPDLVVDATMSGDRAATPIGKSRPGWSSVPAVQNDRLVRIDDDRVLRPGPRVAEGAAILARLAHPEAAIPAAAP